MSGGNRMRGPWSQRFFVIVLGLVLGVLVFWLLGFITRDIGDLPGPDLGKVSEGFVDGKLVEKEKELRDELSDTKKKISNKEAQGNILKDSTASLQNTINQLLSIQSQSVAKGIDLSGQSQATLAESQKAFIENQRRYQQLNQEIAELTGFQQSLEGELSEVSGKLKAQQKLAQKEYGALMSRHRWKIAALKLAVLVPVFLISAWFFTKKRSGSYGAIVWVIFVAAFIRISLVAHEYFPRRYFKYVAILVIIGIVLKLLVYILKRAISPAKEALLKQYQEAYDKWVCAVCGKPIHAGPLRYAIGKKRKSAAGGQWAEEKQEAYTCPSCGTELYEKCEKCGEIRHSLLPFCEHCSNKKER